MGPSAKTSDVHVRERLLDVGVCEALVGEAGAERERPRQPALLERTVVPERLLAAVGGAHVDEHPGEAVGVPGGERALHPGAVARAERDDLAVAVRLVGEVLDGVGAVLGLVPVDVEVALAVEAPPDVLNGDHVAPGRIPLAVAKPSPGPVVRRAVEDDWSRVVDRLPGLGVCWPVDVGREADAVPRLHHHLEVGVNGVLAAGLVCHTVPTTGRSKYVSPGVCSVNYYQILRQFYGVR